MDNPFKFKMLTPLEKAKQLKEEFGDKSLDVVREIYQYGSIIGLREELMYLNSVESELSFFGLNVFVARMKKLRKNMQVNMDSVLDIEIVISSLNMKKKCLS